MKASDFKLLCNLPEGFDYKTIENEGYIFAVGIRNNETIAFRLIDNKLEKIEIKEE